MEKWADYLISHVKKDNFGNITHVLLREDHGNTISSGTIKAESEVIALLKRGYSVKTIMWGYPKWYEGAKVGYVKGTDSEFLRTDRDKTEKDNLDNLMLI